MSYNNIFPFYDFTTDAKGGTEIMISQLLKNVDNELLSKFDILVSYPPPTFVRGEKPVLLWLHDLASDPYFELLRDKDYQKEFDFFIFVSHWQKESFRTKYAIPFEKCVVMKNAIEPDAIFYDKWSDTEKIKIVYSSTPQRGLDIVVEVFKELQKEFNDRIELNVFSSFNLYGEKHKTRNVPFLKLFDEMTDMEGVNFHGSVPHESLLEELKQQHIWVLPSTWQETSCISLMEALSSECLCVHSDLAALAETSSNFTVMYPYIDNINEHAYIFYESLRNTIHTVIENPWGSRSHLRLQKLYIDNFYGWNRRSKEWTTFLKGLIKQI